MPDSFTLKLLLATFAGWVNRHQAQAIDYLIEEDRDGVQVRSLVGGVDHFHTGVGQEAELTQRGVDGLAQRR